MKPITVSRRTGTIIAAFTVVALVLAIGLIDINRPLPWNFDRTPNSEWTLIQRQYSGFSSAGTFTQTPDGFALAGTSEDGSLGLMNIKPTVDGTVSWQKFYGQGSGNAVAVTSDNGFVVAGTKNIDNMVNAETVSLLIKTDFEGVTEWSKTYDGNGFTAVVVTSDGGYVLLGKFNVNGTELPGLMKVDAEGNVLWTKTYSSSQASTLQLYTLIATSDGGYGLVGEMQYTIYGVVMQNGWFVKTDANGETQVNRPFAMDGACVLHSIVETEGGYLIVGGTADSADGIYKACMIGTDAEGHMQWSKINMTLGNLGGTGFEYKSVVKASNGTFTIVGELEGVGATVQAVTASGSGDQYEVHPDLSNVNYAVPNQEGGFAFTGYKDGALWFTDECRKSAVA
ncbi:MAG: hypothetical protein NWF05_02290 [Candidatus Bathyarchaeota archaeon]|nr:hypothetical protein [Candidatus Bathyarchaeota archaeon]